MATFTYTFAGTEGEITPSWATIDDRKVDIDKKQQRLLNTAAFIGVYWQQHRYGPTLREIQKEMKIASLTTIREDIALLADDGFVTYSPKQARTLVPTDKLLEQI